MASTLFEKIETYGAPFQGGYSSDVTWQSERLDYDSNLCGGLFFYIDLLKLRAINSSLYQPNSVIAYMSIPTNM
uniref:Uncharacterized protein n=1 Tax=Glossina palpalis gambiensis TaxID=67801 RepID=A0A1B0BZD6_9MUSC